MLSRKRPLRLGLTGGIGSGKSTVGAMLEARGAGLVDADRIARELTAPQGAAIEAIRAAFGAEFIDGTGALDRARMRELAFNRPEARAQLEAIVHPLVTLHSEQQARQAADQGLPLIVFDVPLLVESGRWARKLDAVLVVDCCAETQIERVMQRSGLSRETVQGILASQARRPARRAVADAVIANDKNCSLDELSRQVDQLAGLLGL